MTLSERLAANSSPADGGCRVWDRSRLPKGYGIIKHDGRMRQAYRVAYEDAFGPIPDGLHVCHRCDNPPCINPDHLFLGTNLANQRDKARKGRSLLGERNPGAVLSEEDVLSMRILRADGMRPSEISRRMGLSHRIVWRAATGRKWKHLPALG